MKWIILAGSSNTRKTWTLTEVVIALVNTCGAKLVSPAALPTPHAAVPPNSYPYYVDGTYELLYRGMRIVVVTDGDLPHIVDGGFKNAVSRNADVLISAARARSGSGHISVIDRKVNSREASIFVLAALDHGLAAMPEIIKWRVQQIIDML